MTFGGVEALLVPWLKSALGGVRAVTELPSDLQAQVPLHRVMGAGGTANPDMPRLLVPRVSIDSFDVGYAAASQAAQAARAAMLSLRGQTINGTAFTFVELVSGPIWVPYPDTQIRQFTAMYQLHVMTPA